MHPSLRFALAALLLVVPPLAPAEPAAVPFGQQSKNAPWVPTPDRMIRRMLQMAETTKNDVVFDLGAGDGRVVIHAAKNFGTRAVGVELEENLVVVAREAVRRAGLAERVSIVQQDLFDADLSKATVIVLYVGPGAMKKLKPRLEKLAPGTRVVSHQFDLGDWDADEKIEVEGRRGYLWVVPAPVEGDWDVTLAGEAFRLHLERKYQKLSGYGQRAARAAVTDARMRGMEIRFTVNDPDGTPRNYVGQVQGDRIVGESHDRGGGNPIAWKATRRAK